MQYDLCRQGKRVGVVKLHTQGMQVLVEGILFSRPEPGTRLCLHTGQEQLDLGVFFPAEGSYRLKCRLPKGRLHLSQLRFALKEGQRGRKFYPIVQDQPFRRLWELSGCALAVEGEQVGVYLPDQSDGSSPDGSESSASKMGK